MPAREALLVFAPGDEVYGRFGKQGATHPIEVTREDVQYIDQPLTKSAVYLSRHPNPAITDCAFRCRKIESQLPNRLRWDTRNSGHSFRGIRCTDLLDIGDTIGKVGELLQVYLLLCKQNLNHGQQQQYIGIGFDEVVYIGYFRRFGVAGINDDYFATAFLNGFKAVRYIGYGHHAPIGSNGIPADDQHKLGMVNVRNGNQQRVSKQLPGGVMMGQLIGRGGRIQVFAAQGFGKSRGIHRGAQVVDRGVALVKRHGIVAIFLLDGLDAFYYGVHRFRPGNGLPTLRGSFHRRFEPIGVFVNVFEGNGLGANVATAERVVFVASNAGNLAIFEFDLKATHGFAKVAVAVVELRHDGVFGVS